MIHQPLPRPLAVWVNEVKTPKIPEMISSLLTLIGLFLLRGKMSGNDIGRGHLIKPVFVC